MSKRTSTEPLSSGNDMILLDKNLLSSKLVITRTVSIELSEQTDKTEEDTKNYIAKNGILKFKIKRQSDDDAYLSVKTIKDESFS